MMLGVFIANVGRICKKLPVGNGVLREMINGNRKELVSCAILKNVKC
jgi:hypothetical protein